MTKEYKKTKERDDMFCDRETSMVSEEDNTLDSVIVTPLKEKVPKIGVRHVQSLLMFMLLGVTMLTRSTMNLAVVAMTDNQTSSKNPDVKTYDWTNTNVILSSFYWTYIIFPSFAGYIFKVFGFKRIIFWIMFLDSIVFTLIPFAASVFGSKGVMGCRMVQGLVQGFVFPGFYTTLGRWVPVNERSKLTSFIFSGGVIGNILSFVITGYISSSWYGWPVAFYLFGACGVTWCVFWFVFGADGPATHPRISEAERVYIMESLDQQEEDEKDAKKLPIKHILTSIPFLVLVISNILFTWMHTTAALILPTYLNKVLGFDISSNGLISASPQVTQLLLSLLIAPVADYIVHKNVVTLMNSRRIFEFLGSIIPALALIALAYTTRSQPFLSVIYLNLIVGVNVLLMFGSFLNNIDLSPKYAGTLQGIENTLSQAVGMTGPLFVQLVVTNLSDILLWRKVFIPLSITSVVAGMIFILFGSAEVQWWNSWESKTKDDVKDPLNDPKKMEV